MTNAYNHLRASLGQQAASTYRNNRRNGVPASVALSIARDQLKYLGVNPNPFKVIPFRQAYRNPSLIAKKTLVPKKASYRLRMIRESRNNLLRAA